MNLTSGDGYLENLQYKNFTVFIAVQLNLGQRISPVDKNFYSTVRCWGSLGACRMSSGAFVSNQSIRLNRFLRTSYAMRNMMLALRLIQWLSCLQKRGELSNGFVYLYSYTNWNHQKLANHKNPGSKFWLKFSYDNAGSAEKNATAPVFRRKITAVTGISWRKNSGYLTFIAKFLRNQTFLLWF